MSDCFEILVNVRIVTRIPMQINGHSLFFLSIILLYSFYKQLSLPLLEN